MVVSVLLWHTFPPSPVISTFGSVVQPYLPSPLHPTHCMSSTTLPIRMLLASQLPVSTARCGLRPKRLLGSESYSSIAVVPEEAGCHHYAHLILDQTQEWLEHLSKSLSGVVLSTSLLSLLNISWPFSLFPVSLSYLFSSSFLFSIPQIAPCCTWNWVRSWGHKNE